MFNSNPFFFKGLLRGRDRAKKMQRCSLNCYPSASAVGVLLRSQVAPLRCLLS